MLLTVVLAGLCVAGLFFFNRAAAPPAKILPLTGASEPDYGAIMSTVTEDALRGDIESLCKAESRFSGTPGCAAAGDLIRDKLRAMGYNALEQPFRLTTPTTQHASILDETGREMSGLRLYPLLPNWFRTATTPPDGLTGRVYAGAEGLAREFRGVNLRGNIALLPIGVSWNTVAAMGAAAIFYHQDPKRDIGQGWSHHVDASANVPRFLVVGDIAALAGRTVTVKTRVDFVEKTAKNIVAFTEVPGADEAIIVGAYYDSYSYAPDLAPGAQQACGAAAFLGVAQHLAREAKELKRSVVLLATAGHGQGLFGIREFVGALGTGEDRARAQRETAAQKTEAAIRLESAKAVLAAAEDPAYWAASGIEAEDAYWAQRGENAREGMDAMFRMVFGEDMIAAEEEVSAARVDWFRDNMAVHKEDGGEMESFAAYNKAREKQDAVQAVMATPPGKVKKMWKEHVDAHHVRQRTIEKCRKNIENLSFSSEEATVRAHLAERLAPYKRLLFVGIELTSASGRIGLTCGEEEGKPQCMPADLEIASQLRVAGEKLSEMTPQLVKRAEEKRIRAYLETDKGLPRTVNLLRTAGPSAVGFVTSPYGAPRYFESSGPFWAGHTSMTLVTMDDNRQWFGSPSDTPDRITGPFSEPRADDSEMPLERLCVATRLATAMVSRFARGHGQIVPNHGKSDLYTIKGQVVSMLGESLTPDHPMPGAVVRFGAITRWQAPVNIPQGVGSDFCVTADMEGKFQVPDIWGRALSMEHFKEIDIDAAIIRQPNGNIAWSLSDSDSGIASAYCVRRVKLAQYNKSLAMPVLFLSAPVQAVPMPDPASLRPYQGFDFIDSKRLARPNKYKVESAGGVYVCFVPPESRLYFTFRKGSPLNPNLMVVGAFALGARDEKDGARREGEDEISGEGYLAADNGNIVNVELDAALSMAQVNSRRLELQQRYQMADEMLLSYNRKAAALTQTAGELAGRGDVVAAKRAASESLAYSSNIHPYIRKNASDAVVGILFYLLLAVPFAIFAEKLLVCHPDLRAQIAFQGLIFVLFFLALRAVHPAYQLVRSSYMILLGFITFSLAVMVSVFVSGRFSQNIAELRNRLRERAEVADVSRSGAIGAAFVLGLSHMRKRPVRTGLTMATLVLTTFVMLCFTSVTSDVVDIAFPLGEAAYTGILTRDRNLKNMADSFVPLNELYGERHVVVQRDWAGNFTFDATGTSDHAQYAIMRDVGTRTYEAAANAILGLSSNEPRVTSVTNAFQTLKRWFESDIEAVCFLPRMLADQLYIGDSDVEDGATQVKISGRNYTVLGIFDDKRIERILDLDGQSLMPIDILSLRTPGRQAAAGAEEAGNVPEDIARLPAESVVIVPVKAMPARDRTASVAVAFQGVDYAGANELITSHLEKSGQPAYYGIDGIAFYGGKFRMQSLTGLLDLLMPIVIAALTVLNTLKGSVYERQDELYVFNAVGLSPSHIRWLFLAEASVYAVVGAVGGYLLAQGVGTGLRLMGLTGGLTMNYSSLSCVFVSVAIMAVVFASSVFPARMAARLAAPAEIMTRQRHTAAGDAMEIDLPFTFGHRDRVAIVPFFTDWFENYGEGSSGEYFCAEPECGVKAEEHGGAAPFVRTTTWLKPYDLGVSQTVELLVRHIPETKDNVATVIMIRQSGDKESWERCCHAFIGLLRKRFLTWRAMPDQTRARLFERGKEMLAEGLKGEPRK